MKCHPKNPGAKARINFLSGSIVVHVHGKASGSGVRGQSLNITGLEQDTVQIGKLAKIPVKHDLVEKGWIKDLWVVTVYT